MKLVDANVLMYAANRSAAHHRPAHAWWETALSDDEPVGLAWVTLLAFLRLSTKRGILDRSLSFSQAASEVRSWLAQPCVRIVRETDGHAECLLGLLREAGTAGNLTTDAHLAALAICHGATVVSFDRDFGRFPNLRWMVPPPVA